MSGLELVIRFGSVGVVLFGSGGVLDRLGSAAPPLLSLAADGGTDLLVAPRVPLDPEYGTDERGLDERVKPFCGFLGEVREDDGVE